MSEKQANQYAEFPQFQVKVGEHRAHYVDIGDGPAVVLIHGSPLSSYSFRHQIQALSSRFRVIAPDLLGFGQSDIPQGGASFQQQVEFLRNLLSHLDLNAFRLLLHDWGGAIGAAAVADRTEQIRQLILVNTTLRPDFKPPLYWKLFTASGIGDFLLVGLNVFSWGLPMMMRAARSPNVRRHYLRSLQDRGTRKTMLALERLEGFAPVARQVDAAIPMLRVPTLILWGQPDVYFGRQELQWLKDAFPHGIVHEIRGGGHFPQEDAPQEMTDALLAFLQ